MTDMPRLHLPPMVLWFRDCGGEDVSQGWWIEGASCVEKGGRAGGGDWRPLKTAEAGERSLKL